MSLTSQNESLVRRLLSSGRYATASEVVREGLRLVEEQEHRRLLSKWLVEGLTKDEEAMLPPDVLRRAKRALDAKIRDGLESVAKEGSMPAEVYFDRWRAKMDMARTGAQRRGRKSA